MENYKVKVGSEAESKEVQGLFFELGCTWFGGCTNYSKYTNTYISIIGGFLGVGDGSCVDDDKELTIPQLRDMVVLKRNDVADATHVDQYGDKWVCIDSVWYFYTGMKKWDSFAGSDFMSRYDLKPITKEPVMKEYLNKLEDGTYKLVLLDSVADGVKGLIEVPEGADTLAGDSSTRYFWKHGVGEKGNMIIGVGESLTRYSGWTGCEDSADVWLGCVNDDSFKIIWQRHTLPEELPFIDDEPKYDPEDIGIAKGYDLDELAKEYKLRDRCDGETDEEYRYMLKHCIDLENYIAKETLNDKVASAEVARQEFIGDQPTAFDTQISGDHYKLLPIQPMKFALANGLDYAQGNVIKYVIRHASKGGKDDLLKAIHNIELMIEHYYG